MGLIDTLINHMQNRRHAELAFALSQREEAESDARRMELLNQRSGFDAGDFARALDSGTVLMPEVSSAPAGMRYPQRMAAQFGPQQPAPASDRVGMLQRIRDRMKATRGNIGLGMGILYNNSRDPFARYSQLQASVPGTQPADSEQYQPRQYADPTRPRYY